MKEVTHLKDITNNKKLLLIDIDEFVNKPKKVECLFDIIVAEMRKEEPKIRWEKAKKKLKNNN